MKFLIVLTDGTHRVVDGYPFDYRIGSQIFKMALQFPWELDDHVRMACISNGMMIRNFSLDPRMTDWLPEAVRRCKTQLEITRLNHGNEFLIGQLTKYPEINGEY